MFVPSGFELPIDIVSNAKVPQGTLLKQAQREFQHLLSLANITFIGIGAELVRTSLSTKLYTNSGSGCNVCKERSAMANPNFDWQAARALMRKLRKIDLQLAYIIAAVNSTPIPLRACVLNHPYANASLTQTNTLIAGRFWQAGLTQDEVARAWRWIPCPVCKSYVQPPAHSNTTHNEHVDRQSKFFKTHDYNTLIMLKHNPNLFEKINSAFVLLCKLQIQHMSLNSSHHTSMVITRWVINELISELETYSTVSNTMRNIVFNPVMTHGMGAAPTHGQLTSTRVHYQPRVLGRSATLVETALIRRGVHLVKWIKSAAFSGRAAIRKFGLNGAYIVSRGRYRGLLVQGVMGKKQQDDVQLDVQLPNDTYTRIAREKLYTPEVPDFWKHIGFAE